MLESSDFYAAFEDRFRGARDDIKRRVSVYLPLIKKLIATLADPALRVLDVGCGRGEWLDALRDAGVVAYGCDTNEVMVSRCRSLGLDAKAEDALSHLRSLPPGSLGVVTGFHIIEHLSLAEQENLLTESFRVLRPGGIALFETPNPENLSVGAHCFYTDPTHLRPLPPALLGYLAEATGFSSVHIVRLHPDHRLATYLEDALSPMEQDVALQLFGPQDFALIAMKQAPKEKNTPIEEEIRRLAASTLPLVERLPSRAMRLQQQFETVLKAREAERAQFEVALQAKEAERAQFEVALQAKEAERAQFEVALQAKEAEARNRLAEADRQALVAKAQAYSANQQLATVYGSYSWRVTKPLRWGNQRLRQYVIRPIGRALLRHPRLAKPIKQVLRQRPALFGFLRNSVLSNTGNVVSGHIAQVQTRRPEPIAQYHQDKPEGDLHIDELMRRIREEVKRTKR